MRVKMLFDAGEYERAMDSVVLDTEDDLDTFCLRILSEFYVYQKSISSTNEESKTSRLMRLRTNAEAIFAKYDSDTVVCYLNAIILKADRHYSSSPSVSALIESLLIKSVSLNEMNWAAWAELSVLPETQEGIRAKSLSSYVLYPFYLAEYTLETAGDSAKAVKYFSQLSVQTPYVITRLATAHHNCRDYESAERLFEQIRAR